MTGGGATLQKHHAAGEGVQQAVSLAGIVAKTSGIHETNQASFQKEAKTTRSASRKKQTTRTGSGKAKRTNESADRAQGKHNQELGRRGESAAARFLDRRGYDIVARNWTCAAGEVDIVARDGSTLVFVEVKTRSDYEKGLPEEAVGPAKRKRYEKIAAAYLKSCEFADMSVRFDVVALVVMGERALIRHHINAFDAD